MDTEEGKKLFFHLQHISILNNLVLLISYGSKLPSEIPYLFRDLIQKGKEYLGFRQRHKEDKLFPLTS
jgi:hypothetical protein